jgi:hypothetical protein
MTQMRWQEYRVPAFHCQKIHGQIEHFRRLLLSHMRPLREVIQGQPVVLRCLVVNLAKQKPQRWHQHWKKRHLVPNQARQWQIPQVQSQKFYIG